MCTRWGHQGATEGRAPAATEAEEGRFRPRRPSPRWLMRPQSHGGAVQEGAAKDRRRDVTDSAEPCAHTTAYCADPESRPGAALGFGGSSEDRGETAGLGLGLAELKLRCGIRAWGGAGTRGGGPLPARLHLQGGRGRQNLGQVAFRSRGVLGGGKGGICLSGWGGGGAFPREPGRGGATVEGPGLLRDGWDCQETGVMGRK